VWKRGGEGLEKERALPLLICSARLCPYVRTTILPLSSDDDARHTPRSASFFPLSFSIFLNSVSKFAGCFYSVSNLFFVEGAFFFSFLQAAA
jgi:hypothetical protein